MNSDSMQWDADLYLQDGIWKLRWREDALNANGSVERRKPVWVGPATGPERITKKEAQRIVRENFPSRQDQIAPPPQSTISIADFVEKAFVLEHVAKKELAGRTHYHAILKHVLTPEEVDHVFQTKQPKARLKAVPDWPYLSKVRLCDAGPGDVQRLVSAALARGYSAQTATHIRNVVSAIFAHAKKKQWFTGDNPAALVTLPEMIRKEAHTLTLAQAEELLRVMQYPEKEMMLISILARMNMAEICGLQWKYVNLTEVWFNADREPIPPRTMAIRKQWYRSKLVEMEQKSRNRNLQIPEPLLPILLGLSQREKFTGPDDFVLGSRTGTPVHEDNIRIRRLKPIGKALQMPWLSWRVIQRTQTTLAQELGMQVLGNHVAKDRPLHPPSKAKPRSVNTG
jgi:hypothetical protein